MDSSCLALRLDVWHATDKELEIRFHLWCRLLSEGAVPKEFVQSCGIRLQQVLGMIRYGHDEDVQSILELATSGADAAQRDMLPLSGWWKQLKYISRGHVCIEETLGLEDMLSRSSSS